MLGSVSDAEDAVQEAFTRLLRADVAGIDDVGAWLVVVVSRVCLDELRSARARHEQYIGPWLPEPVIPAADQLNPEDRVTLDDTVRMALLVVLERLTPAERVSFVLHDVFQYSFDDIARIMGRSTTACRQLASRARRHVQTDGAAVRGSVDADQAARVTERFVAAAESGDMEALLQVLDPEAAGWTDSGGVVAAPRDRVVGSRKVAERLLWWLRTFGVTLVPMPVNAGAGVLALQDDQIVAVVSLVLEGERITALHSVANPAKLAYVKSVLAAR